MFNKKFLYSMILMFCLISLASAQTIQIQETLSRQGAEYMADGLVLNSISQSHMIINENATFYMSAYDDAGKIQDKDDISCIFG